MTDGRPQVHHVAELQLGGDDTTATAKPRRVRRRRRKRVKLRVLQEPLWMPRNGLPEGGRDACRKGERPCPYVNCRHHLWRVDGHDRQWPRRWGADAPPTIAPRWLEYPTPACCALDIAEAVAPGEQLDYATIARALGKTVDWTQRLVRRALRELIAVAPREGEP